MAGCECENFKKHLNWDITWDAQYRRWLYVELDTGGIVEPKDVTECPWCFSKLTPPEEGEVKEHFAGKVQDILNEIAEEASGEAE